ncbi:MAG: methyltransferase domain-containing protein [Phycisphaerae bacterium]
MAKLSNKQYWDSLYKQKSTSVGPTKQKKSIDELLISTCFRNYADYLLWEHIYPRFLCDKKGAKVVEIGSAPGSELVRLHKVFGLDPYGIEYSESGAALNRSIFIRNVIDPTNVINADFLAGEIDKQFESYFDIVISRGFIEHFDDPKRVIAKHINLLKTGGLLIISIPNLRGFNYIMQYLFQHSALKIHNIDIMKKNEFAKLFDDERLSTRYCEYYGTLNFNLYAAKKKTFGWLILIPFKIIQLLLNAMFRVLLRKRGAESKIFSPYLIYIGVKK